MSKLISSLHKVIGATHSACDFLLDILPEPKKTTFDAGFMSIHEVGSRFNTGYSYNGLVSASQHSSYDNFSLFGPTGSGKTSTVILGSVLSVARGGSSLVINDVSSEIWKCTSQFLSKTHEILRLDFSNSKLSQSFNPLAWCQTIPAIQKLFTMLLENVMGKDSKDPYWNISAISLMVIMARYLVFHSEPQYRTIQNVLRMIECLSVNPKKTHLLFIRTGDEELLQSYMRLNASGEKTLQSIISTACAALTLFVDTEVCKTTATDTIDFKKLRNGKRPIALFVCNPLKDLDYYRPISALFFQSLFNEMLSEIPDKTARSVFIILEEAGVMSFPNFSTTVASIRKSRASLLICTQDEKSLISRYGDAEAHQIKTNTGTQIYMPGQPLHTCQALEKIMGCFTYEDEKGEHTRVLMSADEIRQSKKAIILIGNKPPILATLHPIHKNIWKRKCLEMPPYTMTPRTVTDPPLLPLP